MSVYDHDVKTLDGCPPTCTTTRTRRCSVVNVASKCGLTPQYEGLERCTSSSADRGFTVLGVPCNQFGGQEPGSPRRSQTFCSTTYGVDVPDDREDRRERRRAATRCTSELTPVADAEGHTGDIRWNFEKFLVAPGGEVVARFTPDGRPRGARGASRSDRVEVLAQLSERPSRRLRSPPRRRHAAPGAAAQYRLLWTGQLITFLGSQLTVVAVGVPALPADRLVVRRSACCRWPQLPAC